MVISMEGGFDLSEKLKTSPLKTSQLVKWMKLTQVKGLGPAKMQKLLSHFDSFEDIFEVSKNELANSGLFNEKIINEFIKLKNASEDNFYRAIEECSENDIKIITYSERMYPEPLRSISSSPLMLFLWGDIKLLTEKSKIAITGTREIPEDTKEFTYNFAKKLADMNIVVISGGARGVDTAAHLGALDSACQATISVLGSGFFNFYPPENSSLFENIRNKGLLISEHLPHFKGSRISYLQRNRIISGLSDALFMAACTKESNGALNQALWAYQQKKPIFCPQLEKNIMPNDGVRIAINKYKAKQINSPKEIIEKLNNQRSLPFSFL